MTDISVIIPSKNGLPLLQRQLEALARQKTDASWEVLVSDNGSTDCTKETVQALQQGFPVSLTYLNSEWFPGAGGARNLAALQAKGEIIAFCDADDEVSEGWIQAIYRSSKDYDLVGGPLHALEVNGNHGGYLGRDSVYPRRRGSGCGVVTCNLAIKRDIFLDIGGFDLSLPIYGGEDLEFALRLSKITNLSYICDPQMVVYFQETQGIRKKILKMYSSNLSEIYLWKMYPEEFPEMNSQLWVLKLLTSSLGSAISLLTSRSYKQSLRFFLKPCAVIAYLCTRQKRIVKPIYIRDMGVEG